MQALLEAEHSGTTWRDQGLRAAPHFLDTDGTVKVPPSWQGIVRTLCKRKNIHIAVTSILQSHPGHLQIALSWQGIVRPLLNCGHILAAVSSIVVFSAVVTSPRPAAKCVLMPRWAALVSLGAGQSTMHQQCGRD